ncbi:methyltransferase [Salinibacillus kushneri]|uniref:Methyltransferase n=1 Tax=Salinibacillus kushneri TaxID=237682 RepID=A0A1I0DJ22_9BACI|nr:isoprenylcysteine carboxylmethyltransferase family protein [Salinibacillus kushneri]SET31793.1 methyltransferase [Salinibacillus kushneri]
MNYLILWFLIVLQRVVELFFARRNERWMKKRGAKVIDENLYTWMVRTHVVFLLAILFEAYTRHQFTAPLQESLILLFVLLQAGRVWCIFSLGRFWNTKIVVLPGSKQVKRGPYKWISHPNYIVVGLEFLFIPLLFHAYICACLFPILHLALMSIRIPMEEKTLKALTKD